MNNTFIKDAKNILCVDDDEDDREMIAAIIQEIDDSYIVSNAANGTEALQLLENETTLPCLIILDINMPRMGGKETLQKIKAHEILKNIPVVVFTTSTNPADKTFFAGYGVEVRTKPDKFQLVFKEVEQFLSYCS